MGNTLDRCPCGRLIVRLSAKRCRLCVSVGANRRKSPGQSKMVHKHQLTGTLFSFDSIRAKYQWAMAVQR
jgi:hypothetical protein